MELEEGIDRKQFSMQLKFVFHEMKLTPPVLEAVKFQYTNWSNPSDPQANSHNLIQVSSIIIITSTADNDK